MKLPAFSPTTTPLPQGCSVCLHGIHWDSFKILTQITAIHLLTKNFCGSQHPQPVNRGRTPTLTPSVTNGDWKTFLNALRSVSPPSLRTCTFLRLHAPHFITLDSERETPYL